MKTPNILLILLFCPVFLFAQETVEVKEKSKYFPETEVYQVLRSDKKVRHGSYKRFSRKDNILIEEGSYHLGKKDGVWKRYNSTGKIVIKEQYKNGTEVGEWEFYDDAGNVEQRYDIVTGTVVYSNGSEKAKDTTLIVYTGNDSTLQKIDEVPILAGGVMAYHRHLNKTLRYPQKAIDNNVMGTVWIAFRVHADGTADGFWIKKSTHAALDAEALRVIKLMPHKWVPAKLNGKPITVSYYLPVVFRLEEE